MQAIIIAPKTGDYPTQLSYRMLQKVYTDAKKYGLDVVMLDENLANPITFQSFLHFIKPKTKIIIYGGHATPISWVGQWILLHVLAPYGLPDNVPGVKGRILASLPACEPAKILGVLAIKSGAEAFVGSVDFMWAGAGPGLPGYRGYNYADDFIDTWYRFHITLLTTRDVDRAYEVYRNTVESYIERYEEEKPNDWEWHVWALKENLVKIRVFKHESL